MKVLTTQASPWMVLLVRKHLATAAVFNLSSHWDWDMIESSTRMNREPQMVSVRIPIPQVFHRSHKYSLQTLLNPEMEEVSRVRRNLDSCVALNPNATTRYYDDSGVHDTMMQSVLPEMKNQGLALYKPFRKAWRKLQLDPILKHHFVMRADIFRLAIVWFEGGFWLDSDAVCIDGVAETLGSKEVLRELDNAIDREILATRKDAEDSCVLDRASLSSAGCVWAWESEVPRPTTPREAEDVRSSPLNWAFGCVAGHPFLLEALALATQRILAWNVDTSSIVSSPDFAARIAAVRRGQHDNRQDILVDVLHLTGPAMVEKAMVSWGRLDTSSSGSVGGLGHHRRLVTRENPSDRATWDRATLIMSASRHGGGQGSDAGVVEMASFATLLVLPYCFFRSRGCGHLDVRFNDRVIFHHEFDTSWRPSFWHNYWKQEGQ